jgi:hypothetical protein
VLRRIRQRGRSCPMMETYTLFSWTLAFRGRALNMIDLQRSRRKTPAKVSRSRFPRIGLNHHRPILLLNGDTPAARRATGWQGIGAGPECRQRNSRQAWQVASPIVVQSRCRDTKPLSQCELEKNLEGADQGPDKDAAEDE